MARQKLGHITKVENKKVNDALEAARGSCKGELSEDRKAACRRVIVIARNELQHRGLETKYHALSEAPRRDDIAAATARAARYCNKLPAGDCQDVCHNALRIVFQQVDRLIP